MVSCIFANLQASSISSMLGSWEGCAPSEMLKAMVFEKSVDDCGTKDMS